MKIIEESPILDDDELPSQAKKLLGDAIDNSKLVIKEYPDSKYVDDAIFIIAKASFLRDEIARINPDINLNQEIELEGEAVSLDIPMTVEFFWPKAGA